jgi:hypothetical protein
MAVPKLAVAPAQLLTLAAARARVVSRALLAPRAAHPADKPAPRARRAARVVPLGTRAVPLGVAPEEAQVPEAEQLVTAARAVPMAAQAVAAARAEREWPAPVVRSAARAWTCPPVLCRNFACIRRLDRARPAIRCNARRSRPTCQTSVWVFPVAHSTAASAARRRCATTRYRSCSALTFRSAVRHALTLLPAVRVELPTTRASASSAPAGDASGTTSISGVSDESGMSVAV